MFKSAVLRFCANVLKHREMILLLSARDLQSRYAGTLGGMIWAFVHPIAAVCVFYFVFAVGFRAQGPSHIPFILWFVCGLTPWYFFNDTLQVITGAITANAYLVTKTVFPTEILPLVYIISGLFPHFVFLTLLGIMMSMFHLPFFADRLLVLYYLGCTMVLLLGLGWLLSALQVFYRDIGQALTILLNMWFWMTPIVWVQNIVPAAYQGVLTSNPIYYIVQGYRGLMVYKTPIWPDMHETVVFWTITLLILVTGGFVFHRLKPEFADVI
ncbi:MAG TPA: ABC transporter permease [Acidocella sp.]|nr:ABC transporter permease [Acidocella sp.]